MIDDTTLDALLENERPQVQPDPARVARARRAAYEQRTSRSSGRLVVAGIAGAAVLAAGTGAAAATVGLPFLNPGDPVTHTQAVSNGDHCYFSYWYVADGAAHPAAVAAATTALSSLDIDSLDISDEMKATEHSQWLGDGPRPKFVYTSDSLDMRENVALNIAITKAISHELTAQGYDPQTVSLVSEGTCDDMPQAARP